MANPLRPLSTGELLDRTFALYRTHFMLFVGIAALPHLILLAYELAGITVRPNPQNLATVFWTFLWAIGTGVVTLLVGAAAQAATVVAVSQVHLERPTSVTDAFSRVKHRMATVVGLTIVMGIAIGMGFLLLIVPGVLLTLMWSLAVPVAVLENKGLGDAMSRSSQLTQGNRGRIFVIWLLFAVLSLAVVLLLQWPITLATVTMTRNGNATNALVLMQVVSVVVSFISQSLVSPLATIAFALVYYDERVRKEAFDLQLMMTTLDANPVPAAPAY